MDEYDVIAAAMPPPAALGFVTNVCEAFDRLPDEVKDVLETARLARWDDRAGEVILCADWRERLPAVVFGGVS